MSDKIIRFKRDTSFRNELFTSESFAHPAKLDSQLLIWIVERYTSPGDVILDPMFGSGTTMLACMLGRHVIGVELESKFCEMAQANWEKVRQRPQLGSTMGSCRIIHGDARNLGGLLVDKIITSPPYANRLADDAVNDDDPQRMSYRQALSGIDHIVTSPPYEGIEIVPGRQTVRSEGLSLTYPEAGEGYNRSNTDNIGNLKSTSYLAAMLLVYQQCHAVLKPGGLMILIVKSFIRDQKLVDLAADTMRLCSNVGFSYQERWYRELPAQSFWRILYKKRFPDAPELKFEDVLLFRKRLEAVQSPLPQPVVEEEFEYW